MGWITLWNRTIGKTPYTGICFLHIMNHIVFHNLVTTQTFRNVSVANFSKWFVLDCKENESPMHSREVTKYSIPYPRMWITYEGLDQDIHTVRRLSCIQPAGGDCDVFFSYLWLSNESNCDVNPVSVSIPMVGLAIHQQYAPWVYNTGIFVFMP